MADFELGARLRAVRQLQGLSQRELAKRAGIEGRSGMSRDQLITELQRRQHQ